MEVKGSCTACF